MSQIPFPPPIEGFHAVTCYCSFSVFFIFYLFSSAHHRLTGGGGGAVTSKLSQQGHLRKRGGRRVRHLSPGGGMWPLRSRRSGPLAAHPEVARAVRDGGRGHRRAPRNHLPTRHRPLPPARGLSETPKAPCPPHPERVLGLGVGIGDPLPGWWLGGGLSKPRSKLRGSFQCSAGMNKGSIGGEGQPAPLVRPAAFSVVGGWTPPEGRYERPRPCPRRRADPKPILLPPLSSTSHSPRVPPHRRGRPPTTNSFVDSNVLIQPRHVRVLTIGPLAWFSDGDPGG